MNVLSLFFVEFIQRRAVRYSSLRQPLLVFNQLLELDNATVAPKRRVLDCLLSGLRPRANDFSAQRQFFIQLFDSLGGLVNLFLARSHRRHKDRLLSLSQALLRGEVFL